MFEANDLTTGDGCFVSPTHEDFRALRNRISEASVGMEEQANVFVMTTATVGEINREREIVVAEDGNPIGGARFFSMGCFGIPTESYPTVRECMDRMMKPRKGERLRFVLTEDIPVDCLDHPWLTKHVTDLLAGGSYFGLPRDSWEVTHCE